MKPDTKHDWTVMTHANRLVGATSPYLLQHAHNPVNWYPWGDEALLKARLEDKPIFLSIGYSACHWCHVMERESFRNEIIADLLNEHFVAIKVDREERPDLDELYMTAVQFMTGGGGWPLSVFLTPKLKPFFGGTYFPPKQRDGVVGFDDLLRQVAQVYRERRHEVERGAMAVVNAMRSLSDRGQPASDGRAPFDLTLNRSARSQLIDSVDIEHGGLGRAPKFPQTLALLFLLEEHHRTDDSASLAVVADALDAMARGGIHDHVGGGFHRYAVDRAWVVPHFEKMLYDNALLATAFLETGRVTGLDRYDAVAKETLDFLLRDMQDVSGGFHASIDADSPGGEGAYYTWSLDELRAELGEEATEVLDHASGFSKNGISDDMRGILHLRAPLDELAQEADVHLDTFRARFHAACLNLRPARARREAPNTDRKLIVSWNALAIRALVRGYARYGHNAYLQAALRATQNLLGARREDGALPRHVIGRSADGAGFLDDYAGLVNALLDLYAMTQAAETLDAAQALTRQMLTRFTDPATGQLLLSPKELRERQNQQLPAEPACWMDNTLPSPRASALEALRRMEHLVEETFSETIARLEGSLQAALRRNPTASLHALNWGGANGARQMHVTLRGSLTDPNARALQAEARRHWTPRMILDVDEAGAGRAEAHICVETHCLEPVSTVEALRAQLRDALRNETDNTEE